MTSRFDVFYSLPGFGMVGGRPVCGIVGKGLCTFLLYSDRFATYLWCLGFSGFGIDFEWLDLRLHVE